MCIRDRYEVWSLQGAGEAVVEPLPLDTPEEERQDRRRRLRIQAHWNGTRMRQEHLQDRSVEHVRWDDCFVPVAAPGPEWVLVWTMEESATAEYLWVDKAGYCYFVRRPNRTEEQRPPPGGTRAEIVATPPSWYLQPPQEIQAWKGSRERAIVRLWQKDRLRAEIFRGREQRKIDGTRVTVEKLSHGKLRRENSFP